MSRNLHHHHEQQKNYSTKQLPPHKKKPRTLAEYKDFYSCMDVELKDLYEVYQHVNKAREVIDKKDNQLSKLQDKYNNTCSKETL